MSEGESSPEFKAIQAKPPFFKYLAQTWQRLPFSAYLAWYQVFTANAAHEGGTWMGSSSSALECRRLWLDLRAPCLVKHGQRTTSPF